MHKKLTMACMAIAALAAFVIAPAASASPVLTESGSALAVGSSITGSNTGNTFFKGSGLTVECSTTHLKGTVTKNTGTEIAGEIPFGSASFTSTGPGSDCDGGIAGPVRVEVLSKICLATVPKTDNVSITGCGNAPVLFNLNITFGGECEYSRATMTGTFKTGADATVNLAGGATAEASLVRKAGFLCPSTGALTMDLDLTTTAGTTLLVS